MTPNDTQLSSIIEAGKQAVREESALAAIKLARAIIRHWESIRPKEDQSQLQRTNHALAEELKEQAASWRLLKAELATVKAELNARLHERTQAGMAREIAVMKERDAALKDAAQQRDEVQRLRDELEAEHERHLDTQRHLAGKSEPSDFKPI